MKKCMILSFAGVFLGMSMATICMHDEDGKQDGDDVVWGAPDQWEGPVDSHIVDSVFKQVANTNPLIEFMEKTWPGFLNNFHPAESQRRAHSAEHMGEFLALLKKCPEWVNKPVKMDNRGHLEDETLLSFAIGSAVPTEVLKAICNAGALISDENVDHANIWRFVQGKPYLAEVTKYINQRFEEQKTKEKAKARN